MTDIHSVLKRREIDNGEDWALPFADMMTLLLCFFILIVAISSVDEKRFEAVSDTIGEAMGTRTGAKPDGRANLQEIRRELEFSLGDERDHVRLEERTGAVAINLKGSVLFHRGSAGLTRKAQQILGRLAVPLLNIPYRLAVEGHTDNAPIASSRYPSNWELSASRASAVARFLIDRGFPRHKIQVIGLADTRPVAANTDDTGRPVPENMVRNRRVVILVTPSI